MSLQYFAYDVAYQLFPNGKQIKKKHYFYLFFDVFQFIRDFRKDHLSRKSDSRPSEDVKLSLQPEVAGIRGNT